MKFNWGNGIFIFIILFILAVIAFYIFINTYDVNLVEDNYYEKEQAYQEKIDKMKNTGSLAEPVIISTAREEVIISFPKFLLEEHPTGTILFYRPSDPRKDITLPLQLDDSARQRIDTRNMLPGKWTIKLEWNAAGINYYQEEGIFISK